LAQPEIGKVVRYLQDKKKQISPRSLALTSGGSVVERRSLTLEKDHWGDHLCGYKPSATSQPTRPTQPFILSRSTN